MEQVEICESTSVLLMPSQRSPIELSLASFSEQASVLQDRDFFCCEGRSIGHLIKPEAVPNNKQYNGRSYLWK